MNFPKSDSPAVLEEAPKIRIADTGDYLSLLKPRIGVLVVFSALAGMIAAPGSMQLVPALVSLLAIAMGSGAAAAINMWYDHDIDAMMRRTARRAVPSGRIARDEALGVGALLSCLALTLMMLAANPLATALLALSIGFYVLIYTMWLKRRSDQNIVIGGAAGALPPVIGWAAASGDAPLAAWMLFAIVFLWTPPHFWALSLWTKADYNRAKIPMLPVTRGVKTTRLHILVYSLLLAHFGPLAGLFIGSGPLYLFGSALLGVGLLALAVRLYCSRAGDENAADQMRHARNMFHGANLYLFLLFALLIADSLLFRSGG